jgi:hypothetical protein
VGEKVRLDLKRQLRLLARRQLQLLECDERLKRPAVAIPTLSAGQLPALPVSCCRSGDD